MKRAIAAGFVGLALGFAFGNWVAVRAPKRRGK